MPSIAQVANINKGLQPTFMNDKRKEINQVRMGVTSDLT